jgi:hypothetical protein
VIEFCRAAPQRPEELGLIDEEKNDISGRIDQMGANKFKVVSALVLVVTSCLGQGNRGGVNPVIGVTLIGDVLRKADVSGSLAYWGQCDRHRPYPDFPKVRILSSYSGPPREVLQQIFANDPTMRVTQEPGGKIRMVESDVPSDLLDVKIRHISFNVSGPAAKMLGGPNTALQIILSTPEVRAFRRAKSIGPFSDGFPLPGDSGSKPPVSGELDNVTVSQALDYVLETFPGFWIYENCPSQDGGRTVFFNFF